MRRVVKGQVRERVFGDSSTTVTSRSLQSFVLPGRGSGEHGRGLPSVTRLTSDRPHFHHPGNAEGPAIWLIYTPGNRAQFTLQCPC